MRELGNELLNELALGKEQQELLCGHLWLAKHLPSASVATFLRSLVQLIIPQEKTFSLPGLSQAQSILLNQRSQLFFSEHHLSRMMQTLKGLAPYLQELILIPITPHPMFVQWIKDYLRQDQMTSTCIHQAILQSLLSPFEQAPYLDCLLRIAPHNGYLRVKEALQVTSLTKQLTLTFSRAEDDFSLVFDPERALFLGCFQEIFRYLKIPPLPINLLRGAMPLGEILWTTLNRLVDRPDWYFKRVTRSYQAMKHPPLLTILKLQMNGDWNMKILNKTFQIECKEHAITPTNPQELIDQIAPFSHQQWLMLRSRHHLFLVTNISNSQEKYKEITLIGAQYLERPVSEITLSQILLRLCENQIAFNQKIKGLLNTLPISKHQLMEQALKWCHVDEKEQIIEMIDQELSKIFFDEEICFNLLKKLPVDLSEHKQLELIHELMLAIGSANEYPLHLAHIIHKMLLTHDIPTPSLEQILDQLCEVASRPKLIVLGYSNETDSRLVIGYHYSLKRPELFLLKGREARHLSFDEFNRCELTTPKEQK